MSDGAAEELSDGFFDADNQPPWDTWLAYVGSSDGGCSFLLSWVPSTEVERVRRGIDVNVEGCIEWAANLTHLL